MTFYIGTRKELPTIPFDKNNPAFHTTPLSEDEMPIYKHISLPNILYFGSDLGCGCGFRHALLDDGKWLRVEDEEETLSERESIQKNHDKLVKYIKAYKADNPLIEIYGCWDGDFKEVSESVEEISIFDLLDKDFYFKERGFYTIKNDG